MMTRLQNPLAAENLQDFLRHCANLFEHSPWLVERAWQFRPFADGDALYAALCRVLRSLDTEERVRLIRAHPELADRVAIASGMTDDSVAEQASAGLDRLTPAEFEAFHALNADYRSKHGFPFIICARLHGKEQILAIMRERVSRSSSEELDEAIEQIGQICQFRVAALAGGMNRSG